MSATVIGWLVTERGHFISRRRLLSKYIDSGNRKVMTALEAAEYPRANVWGLSFAIINL